MHFSALASREIPKNIVENCWMLMSSSTEPGWITIPTEMSREIKTRDSNWVVMGHPSKIPKKIPRMSLHLRIPCRIWEASGSQHPHLLRFFHRRKYMGISSYDERGDQQVSRESQISREHRVADKWLQPGEPTQWIVPSS